MLNNANTSGKIAKTGLGLLRRLMFDESTIEPDNRRGEDRTPVAGEVVVTVLNPTGEAIGQTRVFIRDLSKSGCGLWSRTKLEPGVMVIVAFGACNGQPPMNRKAMVAHCRGQEGSGYAVGCRFINESPMGF